MVEHAGEFVWSGEGEGAEVLMHAPDERTAERALARVLPAADLPGVLSPVHAAAASAEVGWAAVSETHAAPDLVSVPTRGLLLVAEADAEDLGVPVSGVTNRALRGLTEAGPSLPSLSAAGVRRIGEEGALAAAEDGLIEEEDLAYLGALAGDPDALGRRALSAGARDWEGRFGLEAMVVGEILNTDGAESLDLRPGLLALVVRAGAGDLGRLALGTHRDRISARLRSGADFGPDGGPPAAPAGSEEARDLVSAANAATNFADARAARALYALRRVLDATTGGLRVRASWRVGGVEDREGLLVHRANLAVSGTGLPLVSGGVLAAGTGKMWRSAPPFGAPESEGRWPWEEAGLLERWVALAGGEG